MRSEEPGEALPAESIKVLLVEDSLFEASLLYEGLEAAFPGRFQVAHVRRLSETLEYLWEDTCDVVLLDLGLPDSHGLDTLVLVRAQAPDVPIVVLTGFDDEELGEKTLKEGAQDYLIKGQVDRKLLARSMRYAMARKAAEQALLRHRIAVAKADEMQRSRQRLITAHERVRREVAVELEGGVQEERAAALARRLYPVILGRGIGSALRSFERRLPGVPIEIFLDQELVRQEAGGNLFPERVGLSMYRIVEEALDNVIQHAGASRVSVRLDPLRPGWWRLSVQDDGHGFDQESVRPGLGMSLMQDYARALDGECLIHSSPGAGTEITAALPLAFSGKEHPSMAEKGEG